LPSEEEIKVSVHFNDSKFTEFLPRNACLSEIRRILREKFDQYKFGPDLCNNCFFDDPEYGIVRDEDIFKLDDIIYDNSINIVRINKPDWSELIKCCEYGFRITNEDSDILIGRDKALNIKNYITRKGHLQEWSIPCISHLDHLRARNMVSNTKTYNDVILPWLSIYLDLTKKDLEELLETS
ncbi:7799_t:CDS:1, partial [Acaulospora morrowiae]